MQHFEGQDKVSGLRLSKKPGKNFIFTCNEEAKRTVESICSNESYSTPIYPIQSTSPVTYLGYKLPHSYCPKNISNSHYIMCPSKDNICRLIPLLQHHNFSNAGRVLNSHALVTSLWRYNVTNICERDSMLTDMEDQLQSAIDKISMEAVIDKYEKLVCVSAHLIAEYKAECDLYLGSSQTSEANACTR